MCVVSASTKQALVRCSNRMEFSPRNSCLSPSAFGCGQSGDDVCVCVCACMALVVVCREYGIVFVVVERVLFAGLSLPVEQACEAHHLRCGLEAILAEVEHREIRQVAARLCCGQ